MQGTPLQEAATILSGQAFSSEAMHGWTTDICAAVMEKLAAMKIPFKFVGALEKCMRP
jgi:hypothetical protein